MTSKYFLTPDASFCYDKKYFQDQMKEQGWNELKVIEAIQEKRTGFFYCKYFGEIGEVGEGCGKICTAYNPRNGKSGRCKHSSIPYSPGKEVILKA